MVYFLNTEILEQKTVSTALRKIFGVGKKRSLIMCFEYGIKPQTRFRDLKKEIQNRLANHIQKEYLIGDELKKKLIENNEGNLKLRSYKGNRFKNRLPRRGQRSHTNSKTVKRI